MYNTSSREQARLTQERANEIRYSHSNPPPDRDEATRRLDEVEEILVRMNTSLNNKRVADFGSIDEFQSWKHRTAIAREHRIREAAFLEKWINRYTVEVKAIMDTARSEESAKTFYATIDKFFATAPKYDPQSSYSSQNQPSDDEVAWARKAQVTAAIREHNNFLKELTDQKRSFLEAGCSPQVFDEERAKLIKLIKIMEKESGYLKRYLWASAPAPGPNGSSMAYARKPWDAKPNKDPRLPELTKKVFEIRQIFGSGNVDIVAWLLKIVLEQKSSLSLTCDQEEKIGLIEVFVTASKECRKIEGRE